MLKGIAFDMDGTLTRPVMDFNEIRNRIGGLDPGAPIYEQALKMPEPDRSRALRILAETELEAAALTKPNDGIYELIAFLEQRGMRKAIFTRNAQKALELTLSRLGLAGKFEPVVTREQNLKLKPDPEPVLYILKQWRLGPDEVLVVGDFVFDVMAGKRAGCRTIRVHNPDSPSPFTFAVPSAPTGHEGRPDFTVSRLSEIINIIEGLHEAGPDQG